jgi:hypothetical protein
MSTNTKKLSQALVNQDEIQFGLGNLIQPYGRSEENPGETTLAGQRSSPAICPGADLETAKFRALLMRASFVFAIGLAASPAAAVDFAIDFPPAAAWRINSAKACTGDQPGRWQVYVWTDKERGGKCAALEPGLYPYPENLGVPDNWISSIQAGAKVRARLFENSVYGGGKTAVFPGEYFDTLDSVSWNGKVSSMRVEVGLRDENCGSGQPNAVLQPGEIALLTEQNFQGDCIILPSQTGTSSELKMGKGIPRDILPPRIWGLRITL